MVDDSVLVRRSTRRVVDGLQWRDIDFQAGTLRIERQWNVKVGKLTEPKHGSIRTIAMTEPVRRRLLTLPRGSGEDWVFPTLRGRHFTPSTRAFHWNRVRCTAGLNDQVLYVVTRHFCASWLLNIAKLPDYQVAIQLGHTDGGTLVRELYGHPDHKIALDAVREASKRLASVAPIRTAA